jgi:hypothetical protein
MKIKSASTAATIAALLASTAMALPAIAAPTDMKAAPGEFLVEHPTLINLGFEWRIDGDANRNASVDMSFRKVGETAWRKGLPLARLQNERLFQRNVFDLVTPNMFAGSLLDLEPDTAYEVRLVMSDPDGLRGPTKDATRTVTVKTRAEPMPAAGGKVYHVYPVKWKGPKIEPSFEGIMCAYNYYCGAGDTSPGGRPRVKPGDTILVHAGTYAYHWEYYANQTSINATTTFEGTYYLNGKGTSEKPIVIKAAGDGAVIIDGRNNFNLFNVKNADYNYFEGLTFRNTQIAIWAGTQFQSGAKGLTVKRSRFEDVGMGIFTNYSGSSDFYIADNVIIGRDDPDRLQGWTGDFWQQFNDVEGQQFPPVMKSYTGIRLYGPGHVVAYNYVANFHDGIDTEMYGMPDGSSAQDGPDYPPKESWERRPTAIDIYNNYITNAHDNSIEMDGSMHNIRVMRNMLINSASHPMSTQPSVGGPIYFIRNIVFNAPGGSTRVTNGSPGVFFYNNTVLSETSTMLGANLHWRNNIMLPANAAGPTFSVNTDTNYSSSDYNGFGFKPGKGPVIEWNSPAWAKASEYPTAAATPPLEKRPYATFQDYVRDTKQDQHSVVLGYDALVKVPQLDGKNLATVQRLYKAADFDFGLKPGSAAIDKGMVLPTITDGFSGAAPDLGALEFGKPAPIYGPRPQ